MKNSRAALCATLLFGVAWPAFGQTSSDELSLADAASEAVASNLDLVARRQQLEAYRAEIGLARAPLLPQVQVGARAQAIDDERSDRERGNNDDTSVLLAAGLSQTVYDEESWAGFDVQRRVFEGQIQELDAFELGVIEDAANAFLELDQAERLVEIQESNRQLTLDNIEQSRARIAAGWSSDQEVLRWQAQLAGNDAEIRTAQVTALQNRFELNRLRNRPPEAPATARTATIDEYGFVYARRAIAEAIVSPERDRRMRDVLVRAGLRRSPDLAALAAAIEAADRQLTAKRRAFWVPTLSLGARVDHLTNNSNDNDFNETEWTLQGVVTFPLFQGGAKFAGLDQAREALASLRTQRRAAARTLEQSIRGALARSSGAFETVGFAERGLAAARRNYELVDASYELGVASYLDLLDAQAELLSGEIALVQASYAFLESLVAAERQLSFYAFLESPQDVESLLDQLQAEVGATP